MAETVAKERAVLQILSEIEEKLSIIGLDKLEVPNANLSIMLAILDRLIKIEKSFNQATSNNKQLI